MGGLEWILEAINPSIHPAFATGEIYRLTFEGNMDSHRPIGDDARFFVFF